MSSRGRRAGAGDTRADILEVAREEFATKGYAGTSLRGVARGAGVDPALLHHYFDGKAGLFAEVVGVPADLDERVAAAVVGPVEEAGERIVRAFLGIWDHPEGRTRFRALVGAATSQEQAAVVLRDFVSRTVLNRLTTAFGEDRGGVSEVAVALAGSQLVGMAMLRYVLEVPALAGADPEEIVALLAPTIQSLLVD